jgi:hypothetical protein
MVHRAAANSSVEQRVEILENNLDQLRDELAARDAKRLAEVQSLSASLHREHSAREADTARATSLLESLAVGGLHLESVGVVWLTLGVYATSIPQELVHIWRWLTG